MTLACIECTSWDHMSAPQVPMLPGWSGTVSSVVAGLEGAGQAITNPSLLDFRWTGSYETILVFFRFKPTSTTAERTLVAINTGNNLQIRLKHNNHGVLQVETGAGGSGTWTGAEAVVLQGAVHRIEFVVRVHDTLGSFTVRLNGKTVQSLNVSNVDTKGFTSAPDRVRFDNAAGVFDDCMIRAGDGTYNAADFISDRFNNPQFRTWLPSGRGSREEWSIVSGSGEHWQWIDDPQMDSNATELTTSTQDARECWVMPALPSNVARVRDVSTVYAVRCQVGGPRVRHFLRLGGVDYDHPDATSPLLTTHDFEWRHWPYSPASGTGWLVSEANQLQAGVKRDTATSGDATRISQGAVVITYEIGQTVTLEDPVPVDVLDLVGTSGSNAVRTLRERGSFEAFNAVGGARVDERTTDTWVIAIDPARRVEMQRAEELWRLSNFGALPLLWPESVHRKGFGDVLVTVDQPAVRQNYENPNYGTVSLTVRRWRP